MRKIWRGLSLALVCAVLCGCAAQSAFRDGQAKAEQGQLNEALERFKKASSLEPGSAKYRLAYLRTRDRFVDMVIGQAERARERGELDTAEREYRRVLALDGAQDRALQGLKQLDQQRRMDRTVHEAESAAAKKDWGEVHLLTTGVLRENPSHRRALELQRQASAEVSSMAAEGGTRADKRLAAAYRKSISIEFRDTPIKTVFEVLSRTSGLNFVLDKDVKSDQKASIFLKDSTVEAALNHLLLSNQLDQRLLDANSVLIYPSTPIKQKDYQQLTVRSFYLAHADAKTVAATLKTLLKLRDPIVDEKLNMVIVRDSLDAIRVAEKLVALHDIPEAEVMLDVEILEVKRSRLLDLGVRWPDQVSLVPLPSVAGGALTVADLRNVTSASLGAAVGPLSISAKKTDSDANILANPRIRARNREKAKIHIGERLPNITTTSTSSGFVAESVNYVDVGLKLDVEPTVYLDNEVAIKLSLEVSNIISQVQTKSGTLAYQIGTRTASTVLRLKDGENQLLAGLINDEDRRSANKVPVFGEVPILGRLFGNQADDNAKTEIVLSVTPRVLRNVQRPEAALQQFDSGTETNAGGGDVGSAPAAASPAGRGTPVPPAAIGGASEPAPVAMPLHADAGLPSTAHNGAPAIAGGPVPAVSGLATRWDAPASARIGDVITVRLLAQSDQPITALQLVFGVDPHAAVTGVTEGAFLRQGGATTTFSSQVDPSGQVLVTSVRNGGSGATLEAPVLTATLKVTARPPSGELRLQVVNLSPVGLQGRTIAAPPPTLHSIVVQP